MDQRWQERTDRDGRPVGVELILPDWFYRAVLDDALVLTIDRAYFDLTGGLERWLYRVVRKHGGRQSFGWSFDFAHLHRKSGSLSPLKHFAYDLRDIIRRQPLPGYRLAITQQVGGPELLTFVATDPTFSPRRARDGSRQRALGTSCEFTRAIGDRPIVPSGDPILVLSGTGSTIHRRDSKACDGRNFSNLDSLRNLSNAPALLRLRITSATMAQRLETAGNPPLFCSAKSETRFPLIVNWLCRFTVGLRHDRGAPQSKGGVGKTTLALHLAGEWAGKGKRVTLIDAGPAGLGSRLVATTRP